MLTMGNYIDLYFKEMDICCSRDWLCPHFLQMCDFEENYAGFPLGDTVSQEEVLRHLEQTEDQLIVMKRMIKQYEDALEKLYHKLSDGKEWTLAVAQQTFEEDKEDEWGL